MRNLVVLLTGLAVLTLLSTGCTSNATLDAVQTSSTYANKVKLNTLVYIPEDIRNRNLSCSPSTYICSAWKAEIVTGPGYESAIMSGLSAALASVRLVNTAPTPEMAEQLKADLLVTVVLSNENVNVTASEGSWTGSINTQFQASVTLNFMDRMGQSLYSYTANGSGFGNRSASCDEIAPALKASMETAMKQIADYIAQSTFGASMIRDYEKSISHEPEPSEVAAQSG